MLDLSESFKTILLAGLLSLAASTALACEDHNKPSDSDKTVEESLNQAASNIGETFDKISKNLQKSAPEEMANLEKAGKKISALIEQAADSLKNEAN